VYAVFYLGIMPEARRAEDGGWVLGEGQRDSSPPARVWGSAVSSSAGSGQSAGKFEIWCNLRPQMSLQKYEIK